MMLKAHQEFKSAEQLVKSSKKNIQTQSLFLRSPGQEAQEFHANLICILISGTNQNLKEKKKECFQKTHCVCHWNQNLEDNYSNIKIVLLISMKETT